MKNKKIKNLSRPSCFWVINYNNIVAVWFITAWSIGLQRFQYDYLLWDSGGGEKIFQKDVDNYEITHKTSLIFIRVQYLTLWTL